MTQQLYGTIGLKNISTKSQYFWMLSTASGSTPAGIYVTEVTKDSFESNHTGHNLYMNSNGIYMRKGLYNQIVLQTATTNGEGPYLRLYVPSGSSQGKLSVELDGNTSTLKLYEMESGDTNTLAATLNTNGLKLLRGGIESGEYSTTTNNFIYLSTEDYNTAVEINGRAPASNAIDWRLIVGNKFGVTNTGALYAADVNVQGTINATNGRIGGTWNSTNNQWENGWTIDANTLSNGTFGSSGSMWLTTTNKYSSTSIAGVTLSDTSGSGWRFTVGGQLGVDNTGKLYASGAQISGNFSATSLSTNGRTSSGTGTAGTYIDSSGNIYVGANNDFIIYANGSFYAKSGTISGSLTVDGTSNISGTLSAELRAAAKAFMSYVNLRSHTVDNSNVTGVAIGDPPSANAHAWIYSGGMEVYKNSNGNSVRVAKFGDTTILGNDTSNTTISANSFTTTLGGINYFNLTSGSIGLLTENFDGGTVSYGNTQNFTCTVDFDVSSISHVYINYFSKRASGGLDFDVIYTDDLGTSSQSLEGGGGTAYYSRSGKNITIKVTANDSAYSYIGIYDFTIEYYSSTTQLAQMTLGTYPDTDNVRLFAIGTGTGRWSTQNALSVDYSGNLYLRGKAYLGGENTYRPVAAVYFGSNPGSNDSYYASTGDIYIKI